MKTLGYKNNNNDDNRTVSALKRSKIQYSKVPHTDRGLITIDFQLNKISLFYRTITIGKLNIKYRG